MRIAPAPQSGRPLPRKSRPRSTARLFGAEALADHLALLAHTSRHSTHGPSARKMESHAKGIRNVTVIIPQIEIFGQRDEK